MNTAFPRTLVLLAPTVAAGIGGVALGWVLGFNSGTASANPFPTFDLRAPTTGSSYDFRADLPPGSYYGELEAPIGTLIRFRASGPKGGTETVVRNAENTWEERTLFDASGVVRVRQLTVNSYRAILEVVMDERGIVREFGAFQLIPVDVSSRMSRRTRIGYRSVRNEAGFEDATQSGYYDEDELQR